MRILHLSDRASSRGGADWHLIGVIGAQLERGHHVTLAAGRDDGTTGLDCNCVQVSGLDAGGRAPGIGEALDELAARLQPDVIHIHNAIGPDALSWAAARGAVATVQDHRSFCPGRGKVTSSGEICRTAMTFEQCRACFDDGDYHERIHRLTEARLEALRAMRQVTVLSRYMKAELESVGVGSVTVIPPFVHGLDTTAEADGPACVLFVGRLVQAKGIGDAIEAWRRAGVDRPLVVAGTGPLRQEVEQLGVEVLGWVSHQQIGRAYRRASAMLLPSRWQEPFGIVGLEALQMGVPVVAWDSGGVRDWHPGGDLLVPWGDVDGLARALARAIGRRVEPTRGFGRDELMDALEQVYATAREGGRVVG